MVGNGKGKSEHENMYFSMSVMELTEEKQGRRERSSIGKWALQKVCACASEAILYFKQSLVCNKQQRMMRIWKRVYAAHRTGQTVSRNGLPK